MGTSDKEKPIRWNMNTYGIVLHGLVTLATLFIFSFYSLIKLSNWKLRIFHEYPVEPHSHHIALTPAEPIIPSVPISEPSHSSNERPSQTYLWSDDDGEIMKKIYKNQFPESCKGKKFIMYRLDKMLTRNVGSITTQVAHWMADALISDRIFIWGPQEWDMADCPEKNWDCYFEPISSCSYNDLPPNYTSMEIYDDLKNNTLYDNIDVSIAWRKWWRVLDVHIKNYLKVDAIEFHARSYAFVLRLNKETKSLVEERMSSLLDTYEGVLVPEKTLSIPLRRGDKCKGHHIGHSAPGEDDCIPLQKWIDGINKFRDRGSDVNSFIITCGEEAVVRNMTKLGKENGWNVIWNTYDVMQGTGSANDLQAVKSTLTTRDVIVSIFTSLQLQLHGKYFVKKKHRRYSSWIMLIEYIMVKIPEATPGDKKVEIIPLWDYVKVGQN